MNKWFSVCRVCGHCSCLVLFTALLAGCVAKVQIPAVEQFHISAGAQEARINVEVDGNILLSNLYDLLRANEGIQVPVCTTARDSRQCIKDGFTVFVLGGPIPWVGGRTCYVFSKISMSGDQLQFTKDNRSTTFIGTPMYTQENRCRVYVKDGGLEVAMDRYYAGWMGVGQMFMAEGWAIDFMDLQQGIVGLQLELDIQGLFTTGGGSPYILLKFPKTQESLAQSAKALSPMPDR